MKMLIKNRIFKTFLGLTEIFVIVLLSPILIILGSAEAIKNAYTCERWPFDRDENINLEGGEK